MNAVVQNRGRSEESHKRRMARDARVGRVFYPPFRVFYPELRTSQELISKGTRVLSPVRQVGYPARRVKHPPYPNSSRWRMSPK